ncbi:hypothetical protein [Streptomyces bobili]|uniref:hypothetical protein n=1 Tax=Streptomyces bobili TaxID=67280 RepID=UPI00379C39D1
MANRLGGRGRLRHRRALSVRTTAESDHPLPFGKQMRARVSGWTTRPLAAKPVKKTTPATRLAALFLAAYSSSNLHGTLPDDLPDACRALLPDLQSKNFLADLSGDSYRLDPGVRHLAGLLPNPADPHEPARARNTERYPQSAGDQPSRVGAVEGPGQPGLAAAR